MSKCPLDLATSSARSSYRSSTSSAVSASNSASLSRQDLSRLANDWLLDGQFRLHSANTIETRRLFIKNLLWFLDKRQYPQCGARELKHFFAYLANGHEEAGGRWGNPQLKKPLRPISIKDYFVNFSSMFKWIVSEGYLDGSPMEGFAALKVRASQIQPLSESHVTALLEAAKKSSLPKRDTAIVLLLLDSGLRASELCQLRMNDLDLEVRQGTSIAASTSGAIPRRHSGSISGRKSATPTVSCSTVNAAGQHSNLWPAMGC